MSGMTDLGTWVLMRLAGGPYVDALAGDLMEGLRAGRSNFWYWRQVMAAVGTAWWGWLHTRMGRVVFALGFGVVYETVWYQRYVQGAMVGPFLLRAIHGHSAQYRFAVLQASYVGMGMLYVAAAFLLYLAVSKARKRTMTAGRMAWGMLAGLMVLAVTERGWWVAAGILMPSGSGRIVRATVFEARMVIMMLVAVSLYCVLAWALPVERRGMGADGVTA